MRNAYHASSHPAWTTDGYYQCDCGYLDPRLDKLYEHVLLNHTPDIAIKVLSAKQFYRYLGERDYQPRELVQYGIVNITYHARLKSNLHYTRCGVKIGRYTLMADKPSEITCSKCLDGGAT